jgi:dTDP-4-amino-4,6-dideoxygalactose transaminase
MLGFEIPFTGLKRQHAELREPLLAAWDEVASSGCLMDGPNTQLLENWLKAYNITRYAITCHSGTQALECMAEYYRTISAELDAPRVVMPTLTYAATANAWARAGWEIYFADVDRYGCIDLDSVPDHVGFQALVLVGLYGRAINHSFDVERFMSLSHKDVFVVEDAAQHWLAADGQRIGDSAAISFDPTKNLSANGNGGAIVTDSSNLNDFARSWRSNGGRNHDITGTNSRISEMDAASILLRRDRLPGWQRRRRTIAQYWIERLEQAGIRCLIDEHNIDDHGLQKFVIEIDHRDQVRHQLLIEGIQTRVHYSQPLHEISVFRQWPGPNMLSTATMLSRRVLSLPFYPELTDGEVEQITDRVLAACA